MTERELFRFIRSMLINSSEQKASVSINQLKNILELQNVEDKMIKIIDDTLISLPESKSLAKENQFTEKQLEIAVRRAEERKRREEEMMRRGRC